MSGTASRRDGAALNAENEPQDELEQSQEAAIERLREIAENGLDDRALSGLDDTGEEAIATEEAPATAVTPDVAEPGMPDAANDAGPDLHASERIVEAMLFAAPKPLSAKQIAEQLPPDSDVEALLLNLQQQYEDRGIHLVRVAGKWAFRTADDLSYLLEKHATEERRLSKAALETLSIIAYHQPVTRAEIEEVRGVQTSRGTLDVLMETSWIRPRGRRRAPGKPLTYGTTDDFLSHFGLDTLGDLPGLADLKGQGLLGSDLPPDFKVPSPKDVAALMPDELPLEDEAETDELDFENEVDEVAIDEPAEDGDVIPDNGPTDPTKNV